MSTDGSEEAATPSSTALRTIELLVEFDGTRFAGWQVQPSQRTVAGEVERAIAEITRQQVRIVAASRTDAGVHAYGQVASFQTASRLPVLRLQSGLNAFLPPDAVVRRVREVAPDFHARYSARGKHYRYRILNRPARSPLEATRAWHVPHALDLEAMQAGAASLEGEQDFRALVTQADADESCVRRLRRVQVGLEPAVVEGELGKRLVIDVVGDAFLYKMVRTIVGTLMMVGEGKLAPSDVAGILASRERKNAGPTAPPQGLYLMRVFYGDAIEQYEPRMTVSQRHPREECEA